MARIQCPNCFEQIDVLVESRRNFQSRRCPQGKSAREKIGASLNHCYCKVVYFDDMTPRPYTQMTCCKCGDKVQTKTS